MPFRKIFSIFISTVTFLGTVSMVLAQGPDSWAVETVDRADNVTHNTGLMLLPQSPPNRLDNSANQINHAPQVLAAYQQLPLWFIPNQGQFDEYFSYYSQTIGHTLWFGPKGVTLQLDQSSTNNKLSKDDLLQLHFVKANPQPDLIPDDQLSGVVNYFIGDNPANWQADLPTYAQLTYHNLWPGIDLSYTGRPGILKSTFTLSPQADPAHIQITYPNADQLFIDEEGRLVVKFGNFEIRESPPLAWQEIPNSSATPHRLVSVAYRLLDDQTYTFSLPQGYNPNYPLIIDPELIYSTFFGGSMDDAIGGIVVDEAGYAYVAGLTKSANISTTVGAYDTIQNGEDIFVAKLNPSGTALVYSTYLGGSGNEGWPKIAIDSTGNAYVTGVTGTSDFPTTLGAYDTTLNGADAFVTKLNQTGTALVYSTFIGGSGYDSGDKIAVDDTGQAYIMGLTNSTNLTVTNGSTYSGGTWDSFVSVLNADGNQQVYASYLGDTGDERAAQMQLDGDNNIYARLTSNIMYKIDPDGAGFIFSVPMDKAFTVDNEGYIYFIKSTNTVFTVTVGAWDTTLNDWDAVVGKLAQNGTDIIWATYVGGSGKEYGRGIVLDDYGYVYVTGQTWSTDFPVTPNAFDDNGGNEFIAKFNATGSQLLYATYLDLGLTGDIRSISTGPNEIIYLAGRTEWGLHPTSPGAFDTTINGGQDGFIFALNTRYTPNFTLTKTAPLTATSGQPITYTLTLTNSGGIITAPVVITDVIPPGANYVSGGIKMGDVVSWTFPVLAAFTTVQTGFVVTASQTVLNSDYRVSTTAGYSATGTTPAMTIINHQPITQGNGQILFNSDRDGNVEIYRMNQDGTNQVNLTNAPSHEIMPFWSPDGTKIAFLSDRTGNWDIYVMEADGTGQANVTRSTRNEVDLAWSPDGTQFAFATDEDGDFEIYTINIDGSNSTKLTDNSSWDARPDWSPDGAKIIFNSDRGSDQDIYVMNVNGTGVTNLSNSVGNDWEPAWSPDGTEIAFISQRDGNFELYKMQANGTGQINLTNNSFNDYIPDWSPDGTKISFMSERDGNNEIYVMNVDGSGVVNLTNNSGNDGAPNWYAIPVAPTVIAVSPLVAATGVALTASLVITFDQPMQSDSVQFTMTPDPGGWSLAQWNGAQTTATFSHTAFAQGQPYTVTVNTAQSQEGLSLQTPYTWTFSTNCNHPLDWVTQAPLGPTSLITVAQGQQAIGWVKFKSVCPDEPAPQNVALYVHKDPNASSPGPVGVPGNSIFAADSWQTVVISGTPYYRVATPTITIENSVTYYLFTVTLKSDGRLTHTRELSPGNPPAPYHREDFGVAFNDTGQWITAPKESGARRPGTEFLNTWWHIYLQPEQPVSGLNAANNSPTALGQPTTLTATVSTGENITYTWAFGDGTTGSGTVVTHTYPSAGAYTAVVTASNQANTLTATTIVTIGHIIPPIGDVITPIQGITITVNTGTFSDTIIMIYLPWPVTDTGSLLHVNLFYYINAIYELTGQPAQPQPGEQYTIILTYNPAIIPDGINEADLGLYYWDNTQWVNEPTGVVNPLAHTVTAVPNHFSLWAILAESSAEEKVYLPVIIK